METHPFAFGSKVIADCWADNIMTVVAITYARDNSVLVKCVYWCNGDHKEAWIDAWRLTQAPPSAAKVGM